MSSRHQRWACWCGCRTGERPPCHLACCHALALKLTNPFSPKPCPPPLTHSSSLFVPAATEVARRLWLVGTEASSISRGFCRLLTTRDHLHHPTVFCRDGRIPCINRQPTIQAMSSFGFHRSSSYATLTSEQPCHCFKLQASSIGRAGDDQDWQEGGAVCGV